MVTGSGTEKPAGYIPYFFSLTLVLQKIPVQDELSSFIPADTGLHDQNYW